VHYGPENTGGVLTFFEPVPQSSVQFATGVLTPEQDMLYREFSLEKPTRGARLGKPNSYTADYDPEGGKYAGAFDIASLGFWASWSGYDELDDVAHAAHCLLHERVIMRAQMLIIFKRHGPTAEQGLRDRQAKLAEACGG
jgi:hypothetical protein